MYFYKNKGKQVLDLRGDLILTHNVNLVTGRVKSAAPSGVRNAKFVPAISTMSAYLKLKTTFAAIRFIWGPSQALSQDTIDKEGL